MRLVPAVGDTPTLTGSIGTSAAGADGEAQIRRPDTTVILHPVTWTDEPTGSWCVPLVDGDLDQAGDYYLRIKVTFAGGAVQTFAVDSKGASVMFHVLNAYT